VAFTNHPISGILLSNAMAAAAVKKIILLYMVCGVARHFTIVEFHIGYLNVVVKFDFSTFSISLF
jgi:hypothetical protein